MGSTEPMAHSGGFWINSDFEVTTGFGLNVFLRDGDEVFRAYFTSGRGLRCPRLIGHVTSRASPC